MNYFEQFDNNGYVILKGVFSDEQLVGVRILQEKISEYADNNLEDPFAPWSVAHRDDQGVLYDLYQRHPKFSKDSVWCCLKHYTEFSFDTRIRTSRCSFSNGYFE